MMLNVFLFYLTFEYDFTGKSSFPIVFQVVHVGVNRTTVEKRH